MVKSGKFPVLRGEPVHLKRKSTYLGVKPFFNVTLPGITAAVKLL